MSCQHGNWEPCDECGAIDEAYKRGFVDGGLAALSTQPQPQPQGDAEAQGVGGVEALPAKWRAASSGSRATISRTRRECADELQAALTATPQVSGGGDAMEALRRAEMKLAAYVGVCKGDKELTEAVLPMVRAALSAQPRPSASLYAAAKTFYNATIADPDVILRCPNSDKQSAVAAAGQQLREALVAQQPQPPSAPVGAKGPEYSWGADGSVLADFTGDPGYTAPPPADAPVGVGDLKKRAWELLEAEYERDYFAGNFEDAAIDAIAAALAQQPAADMRDRLLAAMERAAAAESELSRMKDGQQPAVVDWKAMYRIQTAMRYMDNMPDIARDAAFRMADQDCAGLEALPQGASHDHD